MGLKFRKKPVIIEAFQMTRERRNYQGEWPEWLKEARSRERDRLGSLNPTSGSGDRRGTLSILTLAGRIDVSWGDYIIQDVNGELHSCGPHVFKEAYEPVDDESNDTMEALVGLAQELVDCSTACDNGESEPAEDIDYLGRLAKDVLRKLRC